MQKPVALPPIQPPPPAQRVGRGAHFAPEGQRRDRYALPEELSSASPVGYRVRPSFTEAEAARIAPLLSLESPERFVPGDTPTEVSRAAARMPRATKSSSGVTPSGGPTRTSSLSVQQGKASVIGTIMWWTTLRERREFRSVRPAW